MYICVYLLMLIIIGGIAVGGALLYGITNIKHFALLSRVESVKDFFVLCKQIFGGSVFYGGLIGACLFGWIGVKSLKLDMVLYADLMAVSIPLFHGFGRIGCFLGGCCYGIESDFGFIIYGNPLIPEVNGVRRFPVQLLESGCNFIIFAILLIIFVKIREGGKIKGRLLLIYAGLYSITRFFVEYLRGDTIRGFIFGLSTSQLISALIMVTSLIYLLIISVRSKNIIYKSNFHR